MMGMDVHPSPTNPSGLACFGCQAPIFSVACVRGANPFLGVEVAPTGETARPTEDQAEAHLRNHRERRPRGAGGRSPPPGTYPRRYLPPEHLPPRSPAS